ncbi:hypothetical protein V8E54_005555 [Elaphomyces granulatus]
MAPPKRTPIPDSQTQSSDTAGDKRPRSDSLHQLELDKARIALEREQKALVFEQELHQRRLAHLDAEAVDRRHPNPQLPVSDDEGEISPVAKEVALSFPAVPQKEIAAIFEGKSGPANLYKLHRKVSLAMEDDEEISISGGKIHSKKLSRPPSSSFTPGSWSYPMPTSGNPP